ncbi:MAG: helix-turn-helix transcriptional regulator [Clostridia bacterium]|nr:helix-turn-helix transcriptional regulator [Clostridia bacterium]
MLKTRIKDLREDNDYNQSQISNFLNISQVAYSYYELGRRSIPLEILCKIADFYQTSVDYLLYRTDVMKSYSKSKTGLIISEDVMKVAKKNKAS